MCSDSWFIDEEKLDQYQMEVLRNAPPRQSFVVTGCAGSGKTNLAIWKAQDIKAKNLGSYLLIVYTKALRIFIEDGIKNAELDPDKVMHYRLWENAGNPGADYIIVDEAQDFTHEEINHFNEKARVALILYGDGKQQIYGGFPNRDNLIDLEQLTPHPYPGFKLLRNHRLPKKIARVAASFNLDSTLVSHCVDEGVRSPVLLEIQDLRNLYKRIVDQITSERLTHVGIFLPYRRDVTRAYQFFSDLNFNVEVRMDDNAAVVNAEDLRFNNSSIPKLCTYHSSKGLQFHHVFLPECSVTFEKFFPALYVAMTRTCEGLYIYYSDDLCPKIERIDRDLFNNTNRQIHARDDVQPEDDLPF